jgi:hypothetical protein
MIKTSKSKIQFKHGMKPFIADKYGRDILYDNYRKEELVGDIPTSGGYKGKTTFGMNGNDQYGCCGEAGIDHGFEQTNAIAGRVASFSTANTLSDYGSITGFNSNDPNSDQGTDMKDAYSYAIKTGMIDANGKRHKLGAYLLLNNTQKQLEEIIYIYDRAGIGFKFPDYAMTDFNAGKDWDYKPGQKYTQDGEHYVEGIYYDETGVTVVTWGKEQKMTWAFFLKFIDQSYLLVDPELLNGSGVTPNGLNLDQLNSNLNIIKLGGVPIINATPPIVNPPIAITPNVVQAIADGKTALKQTSVKKMKPYVQNMVTELGGS